jgi:hypothetical protein
MASDDRVHRAEPGLEVSPFHADLEFVREDGRERTSFPRFGFTESPLPRQPIPEKYPHADESYIRPKDSTRNPFGLRPVTFGLLIALVTLIIVGAAVGGGLGGSLAASKKQCK